MLSYIVRRLLIMVPTLFGVTVVSFWIMKLAPGSDPLFQLQGGAASQANSRDDYRVKKREFYFDKPLFLNFRYFHDYSAAIREAAFFRARSVEEIKQLLPALNDHPDQDDNAAHLSFLRTLGIADFQSQLNSPEHWSELAESIDLNTLVYCEDSGHNAVPAAMAILEDSHT